MMEEQENLILFFCAKHFGPLNIKKIINVNFDYLSKHINFINKDDYNCNIFYCSMLTDKYILVYNIIKVNINTKTSHSICRSINTYLNDIKYSEEYENDIV